MGFKSDGPAYTHIRCPRCGKQDTVASWKINDMFADHGVVIREWSFKWLGARMRCTRCDTKGMELSGR